MEKFCLSPEHPHSGEVHRSMWEGKKKQAHLLGFILIAEFTQPIVD